MVNYMNTVTSIESIRKAQALDAALRTQYGHMIEVPAHALRVEAWADDSDGKNVVVYAGMGKSTDTVYKFLDGTKDGDDLYCDAREYIDAMIGRYLVQHIDALYSVWDNEKAGK